jgi:hypothetical protein
MYRAKTEIREILRHHPVDRQEGNNPPRTRTYALHRIGAAKVTP